jgi:hypothetical protein
VGETGALLALVAVPFAVLAAVLLPSLVTGGVALGSALPGGADAGVALAAAVAAAAVAGAVVAEAGIALARGCIPRAAAIGAAAVGWIALGDAIGCAPLGTLAAVPEALRDRGPAWPAILLSAATGAVLASVWVRLAASRPRPRTASARRTRGVVRRRCGARAAALAAILARRREVHVSAVGAIFFGVGGVVLAGVTSAPTPAGLLLGATTALLGTVLAPLVVGGVLLEGRWLWAAGACTRRSTALAAVAVGLTAAAVPVLLVAAVAATTVSAPPGALGAVAGLTAVAAAAALVAGSLVPWRGDGAGDQVTTFAAFVAVAVLTSLVVAVVAPRVVSLGVPDPVVAVGVCTAAVALAAEATRRRIGRAAR